MQRSLDGLAHHSLSRSVGQRAAVEIRGTIVDDAAVTKFAATALLRASSVRVARGAWLAFDRTVLLRGSARNSGAVGALEATDTVTIVGDLSTLSGFDARWQWKHAVARVEVFEVQELRRSRNPLYRISNGLRAWISNGLILIPADDRALLSGFLLGDTRQISDTTVTTFRDAGLSHLLAVSGANVAFVLVLIGPILKRRRIGARFVIGVSVVVVFAAMTRFEPSVLRASAMALIVMLARLSGRSVSGLRALSYTVVVLIAIDPFLIHSVGFQLSVAACAGIVLIGTWLQTRLPGPRWMRAALAVSLAAQIGVAPVLLLTFGATSWVAPAANLFAVPAAEPITVIGLPLAFIGAVVAPIAPVAALARVGFLVVQWLLAWVRFVGRVGSERPLLVAIAAVVVVFGAWRLDSTP